MAEQNILNQDLITDKQYNSLILEEYKFDSCRTKIRLNLNDLIENRYNYDSAISISNFSIGQVIRLLIERLREKNFYLINIDQITLYAINNISNISDIYVIVYDNNDVTKSVINELNKYNKHIKFITESDANNLIVEENIIINSKSFNIHRHINSFYQTDDSMRKFIHKSIYEEVFKLFDKLTKISTNIINNCIFLGGEMYIYGKIFDNLFDKKIYISDTISLYLDAINNDPCPKKSSYFLTNYKIPNYLIEHLQTITDLIHIDMLISNISKTGLGENICNQINNHIKPKYLILITCSKLVRVQTRKQHFLSNLRVTERDIKMLTNYILYKQIKITTNYDIFLSFLHLI